MDKDNLVLNFSDSVVQKEEDHIRIVSETIIKRVILPDAQLSLSFINKDEIKQLNNEYRSKDKPTDVLTFCIDEEEILGDIYISLEIVKENAIKFDNEYFSEISRVVAHAFSHLVGYDHKTDEEYNIMRDYEKFLLKETI